jgi:anti-sigma regulatory factor (Ser/Thr protein kinase)
MSREPSVVLQNAPAARFFLRVTLHTSMSPRRAICVSRDRGLRRVVEHALARVGVTVEHREDLPSDTSDVVVVVVDRATRETAAGELRMLAAPVVVLGDCLDNDGLLEIMHEAPVSHLIEDPSDRDLGITSHKLASGDLFGVEKYLADGTEVGARGIASDADKRHAIGRVCAWAEAIGARRPVLHRLANVVDELVMNALHDTPQTGAPHRAELRWGADRHAIAVSVSDEFGALRQRDVIDHVRRARSERGRPRPEAVGQRGAGLGLYLVASSVASLVINVEAGRRTEVVCLFDLASLARSAPSPVRSLHVFQQPAP